MRKLPGGFRTKGTVEAGLDQRDYQQQLSNLGTPVVPSLLKRNSRKKGTLIVKGVSYWGT